MRRSELLLNDDVLRSQIKNAVEYARIKNPMAPSVTNTVTQDFVANAQLAVGGSAAMLYLPDECEAVAAIAPALYINMGTALPFYAETLPRLIRALHQHHTPWVLDPVGIGMSSLRTELIRQIKNFPPSIVRGNASEIIAVAKLWHLIDDNIVANVRGVDSTDDVESAKNAAVILAQFINGVVAVSGPDDLITDGKLIAYSSGGSPLLTKITGSGCSLGGVMAVYLAVTDPFTAAVTATAAYNEAGTFAASNTNAPASFKVQFLDALYSNSSTIVSENDLHLEEV